MSHSLPRAFPSPADEDDAGFAALYGAELTPLLRRHEKRRLIRLFLAVAIAALAGIASYWLARTVLRRPAAAPLYVLGGAALGFAAACRLAAGGLRKGFKRDIVGRIAAFAHPQLAYDPESGIDRGVFLASRIQADVDRYRSEDLFSGRIGGADIEFAVVNAGKTLWPGRFVNAFGGVHCIVDTGKDCPGEVLVLPKRAGSMRGRAGRRHKAASRASPSLAEVVPGNAEFASLFRVHASSPAGAGEFLTPSRMERLCRLRRDFGNDFSAYRAGLQLHAAFPMPGGCFEPRFFRSILHFGMYRDMYRHILFFAGVAAALGPEPA